MAVSGSFKASPAYTGQRGEGENAQNWGTATDVRAHNDPSLPDYGFPAAHQYSEDSTPEGLVDFYDPQADDLVYLQPADREPRGHDVPSVPSGHIGERESQDRNNRARMVNLGANTSVNRPVVTRDVTETYSTPREQSLPPASDQGPLTGIALRALRGRNSLAINNPGSAEANFSGNYNRQGFELSRLSNRRMPMRTLTHTKRALHLNAAQVAMVSDGIDGTPYSSPFPSKASMAKGANRPMLRRQPRQWDEDVVTDGTQSLPVEAFPSWGL